MHTGKLIAVEGSDGSGKTTQTQLLLNYVKERGFATLHLKFPRADTFFGELVYRFLRGELGTLKEVDPRLISLVFAQDRAQTREQILHTLSQGGYVIVDRYVPSNIAQHAAKFTTPSERQEFINWVEELEYKELQVPKEDAVIYLWVPHTQTVELAKLRGAGDEKDIHEEDIEYRREVENVYEALSNQFNHWTKVNCVDSQDHLLSKELIHEEVKKAFDSLLT